MLAYVNGRFIPEEQPAIAVNDRSFRYGDGLFETIRIQSGEPFLFGKHLARLRRGADFLKMSPPEDSQIEQAVKELINKNDCPDGAVRIQLSRGPGARGYSYEGCDKNLLVITTHDVPFFGPAEIRLIKSSLVILANDPCSQFKTVNRLTNVRAKNEADERGADEAIILNQFGNVVEGSAANIFAIFGDEIVTPPLAEGPVAGTTREFIQEFAPQLGLKPSERPLRVDDLYQADGVFLTSTFLFATPAVSIDGNPLDRSAHHFVKAFFEKCYQTD